jgi:hypothetical protein
VKRPSPRSAKLTFRNTLKKYLATYGKNCFIVQQLYCEKLGIILEKWEDEGGYRYRLLCGHPLGAVCLGVIPSIGMAVGEIDEETYANCRKHPLEELLFHLGEDGLRRFLEEHAPASLKIPIIAKLLR